MKRLTTLFINHNITSSKIVLTILQFFSFNILNLTIITLNSIFNLISTRVILPIYSNRFFKRTETEKKKDDILIRTITYFVTRLELVKRRSLSHIKNKILSDQVFTYLNQDK